MGGDERLACAHARSPFVALRADEACVRDWLERHVFPGGCDLRVHQVLAAIGHGEEVFAYGRRTVETECPPVVIRSMWTSSIRTASW